MAGEGLIRDAARRLTSFTPLLPSLLEFIPPPSYSQPDDDDLLLLDKDQILEVLHLENEHMTPKERNFTHITWKAAQSLPNWPVWRDTFFKQL